MSMRSSLVYNAHSIAHGKNSVPFSDSILIVRFIPTWWCGVFVELM